MLLSLAIAAAAAAALLGLSVRVPDDPLGASGTTVSPTSAVVETVGRPTDTVGSSTSEPTTTTERKPLVHVAPWGDDAANGQSRSEAVRSPERAVELALPGDTVLFDTGRYPAMAIQNRSDLVLRPLGEGPVIFSSESYERDAGILIQDSQAIEVLGLSVERSLWGVMVERSSDISLEALTISDTGQEAIHVKDHSTRVSIRLNAISDTGNRPGDNGRFPYSTFGEGIYLGSGSVLPDGSNDETSHVTIEANVVERTSAEAIDIKPFVHNVTVVDNVVRDVSTATSGAIVVGIGPKLYADPQVEIRRNVVYATSRTSQFRDGNAIRISAPAFVFENIVIGTEHHGIVVDDEASVDGPGVVVVERNIVVRTGLDAIVDQSGGAIAVQAADNLVGSIDIDDETESAVARAEPGDALWKGLWDQLVALESVSENEG